MKRPFGESGPEKTGGGKKKKKNTSAVEISSAEPKSILKKSKTEKSSEIEKTPSKKNKLKTIKIKKGIDAEPKKSVVKSKLSLESNNQTERDLENSSPEVKEKKSPKTNIKGKSKFLKNKKDFKSEKFNKKPVEDSKPVDKKESRKKQKELRLQRREKEKGYVLPEQSKKIFEELRCKKCPAERRIELASELYKVLKGKFVNSARSHELSRMTQWIIKVGSKEIKDSLINEVIEETVSLSKLKYANHIVQTLLHDGNKKVRKRLLEKFLGNISDLVRNKFSAPIIEEYYTKFAKNVDKVYMRQELYSDLFRAGRNQSYSSLSEVIAQNLTLKSAILKSTKMLLSKLIDKPFALSTNIVTDVLYDYLQNCEDQDKIDIMEILKSNLTVLFKTKSGNQVMMLLMWESTPKVKKHMVKELKAHILSIAKSSGNIFLRSLFDSVDDTVLIKKAILPNLLDNAENLVKDVNGKKVILYLVAHRDTAFFHPAELEKLKKADESSFVKKDISLKEKELLTPCLEALLEKIKTSPEFWFSEGKIGLVTQAVLSKGTGAKLVETYNSICNYIIECVKSDNFHPIEDPGLHLVLRKMMKNFNSEPNYESFPECLIKMCDVEVVNKLLTINRGCFLLAFAVETDLESILLQMKEIFKNEKIVKKLEKQESVGSKVLQKRLKEKNVL